MRVRVAKITFLLVFVNIVALYYSWRLISKYGNTLAPHTANVPKPLSKTVNKHISKSVTVLLRDFELHENDVTLTVESVLNVFPNIQILVLCDGLPYPPLDLMFANVTAMRNVRIVNLSLDLNVPIGERYPLFGLRTKYVLFLPDATRLNSRHLVQTMLTQIARQPGEMVAATFAKDVQCLTMALNRKEWSLRYETGARNGTCDAIASKHALLVETQFLRQCADPFMLPFPEALYIQTAVQGLKVSYVKDHFLHNGKPVHRSHHAQWKQRMLEGDRRRTMYEQLAIKQVVRETGTVEWYGCTRDSARCFGTVLDSTPSYLYLGRWTPPCCLANLRSVARHVFDRLDEAGVRYWLDGGSLLGAMRHSDILPWDHDVDIGVNRDDIRRCELLTKARNRPLVDARGHVWEKATEGDFFRVQFSKTNRIHVNVFPFVARNGTMAKDTWFTDHKHMEFPEHFLHPMSSIEFLGRQVPSPNNIRDFLELKYGNGVIERPQYPDPKRVKFL